MAAVDPVFLADCPYGPGGFLIDEIVSIEPEASRVVCRMPSHDELPITREQRVHPTFHPRHISGGLMVHMTGMVAFVHSYYILGMRHADGWIGYGGRIHHARFRSMGVPGIKLELECVATTVRKNDKRALCRYKFEFRQEDRIVYEGDQTAMWFRVQEGDVQPADATD